MATSAQIGTADNHGRNPRVIRNGADDRDDILTGAFVPFEDRILTLAAHNITRQAPDPAEALDALGVPAVPQPQAIELQRGSNLLDRIIGAQISGGDDAARDVIRQLAPTEIPAVRKALAARRSQA